MDTSELMIGNYVKLKGYINEFFIVRGLSKNGVWVRDDGFMINKNDVLLIDLTEDWLYDFGFQKVGEYLFLLNECIPFRVYKINDGFLFKSFSSCSFLIKTVCQLQNIYFSMTVDFLIRKT